jgi:hypothetical protein
MKDGRFMKNGRGSAFPAFLWLLLVLACLSGTARAGDETAGQKNPYGNAAITIKIIPAPGETFGYDILLSGKPLIHQPHIPGLPGNEGFATEEKAQAVAEFVVGKIRNNEMPPKVTLDDLKGMGVLK